MNELRWILLAAGIVLIAGLYLWGMRSRRDQSVGDAVRRPAVFTGGARGFETELEQAATVDEVPVLPRNESRAERRIEPAFGHDDVTEQEDSQRRHADFNDIEEFEKPAIARREPTLGVRPEPARLLPVESSSQREQGAARSPESLDDEVAAAEVEANAEAEAEAEAAAAPDAAVARPKRVQKIVALRVSAATASLFEGPQLLAALRSEGLGFGRYEIFHRLHDDGRPIFSVASLREPGTFDLAAMPTTLYPGIAMFTVLPGPVPAGDAFDEMIFTARALATYLNGALADERGVPLTAQRAGRLREEAVEFERSAGSA